MQGKDIKMLRRIRVRIDIGIVVLSMVLVLFAGCASNGKVKPNKVVQEVKPNKVVKEPSIPKGPSVTRLENGWEGFIITEVPKMDEASHRDFDHAVAMLEKKEYEKAIDLLKKIIEKSPGVTAPYIDIAIAYQDTHKLDQAEKYLKTALALFPDHPVVCNEYGLLYRKTGRFAEARAIYEKAIAVFPDYYPLHRNLGILCDLYLNDPACALKHYEIYSKAQPDNKKVKAWIADLHARLGRN